MLDTLTTPAVGHDSIARVREPAITAFVAGTGSALPDRIVPNAEFERRLETTDEWIRARTGIRERRIAGVSERTSQYAARAAKAALASGGTLPDEVGMIILATTTPDMRFPATANFVQKEIGAANAFAYDISVACSGFVFGLASAHAHIQAGVTDSALVIGADLYSSIVDARDRNTCVLFGDGAGAVLVKTCGTRNAERGTGRGAFGASGNDDGGEWASRGILAVSLHSDTENLDALVCGGSGTAGRSTTAVCDAGKIRMDGGMVFRLAARAFARAAREVLEKAGRRIEDVACVIPHQANIRIIEKLASDLGCGMEKMMVNLDRYGNTSSASIPIALDEAVRTGRVREGDVILLAAAGAGFSSGAILLRL